MPNHSSSMPDSSPVKNADHSSVKKILAIALLLFPLLSILGFALHFHSLHGFFSFKWSRPPYNAEGLFNALTSGRGHGFFIAHVIVYLAVPFLLAAILVLSGYLFPYHQWAAFMGAALGVLGSLAMAGVVSSWLSFAAVGRVQPEYYEGARAALVELTTIQGILKWNTLGAYLIFVGFMILSTGLLISRQFPKLNMICIFLGSLLFMIFMDMDNWMLIATLLIFIGLLPAIKRLWRSS